MRINGVVHLNAVLPRNSVVPIGWVAVGDPPRSCRRENMGGTGASGLPRTVFGVQRAPAETVIPQLMRRYARSLERHFADHIVDAPPACED